MKNQTNWTVVYCAGDTKVNLGNTHSFSEMQKKRKHHTLSSLDSILADKPESYSKVMEFNDCDLIRTSFYI